MEKNIKRKIGVLVVLGMLVIGLSGPFVLAASVDRTESATGSFDILIDSDGDGTTEIFSVSHDSTGSPIELFRIQENGNVGIGTASPTSALEVNGDIEVQDDDWIGIGSSSERIIFDSNGDDIELIGGNVGIGTTGPVATLSVAGEVVVGTTWAFTAPPPPTGGMIIEGNVGIGTDSPQGALNVDNTGEAKGLGVSLDTYHIQTTNANPTIIATISTATDKAYGLTVTTIGIKSDGTEAAHYVDHATFKNDGGSLAAVGTVSSAHAVENDVSWGVTITPSGTNILVHVTGNTGDTVEWQTTVEMNIVGV